MSTEILECQDETQNNWKLVLSQRGSRGSRQIKAMICADDYSNAHQVWLRWEDVAQLHEHLGMLLREGGINPDGYYEERHAPLRLPVR
jgi:hypothetical protein